MALRQTTNDNKSICQKFLSVLFGDNGRITSQEEPLLRRSDSHKEYEIDGIPETTTNEETHSASDSEVDAEPEMDECEPDSTVLVEEIDPNYEPTHDEILEYAKWLGMNSEVDQNLLWIAKEGLKAPLPAEWKPCKTTDTEEIYYFNFSTGQSTWDHPCDDYYRTLYEEEKRKDTV